MNEQMNQRQNFRNALIITRLKNYANSLIIQLLFFPLLLYYLLLASEWFHLIFDFLQLLSEILHHGFVTSSQWLHLISEFLHLLHLLYEFLHLLSEFLHQGLATSSKWFHLISNFHFSTVIALNQVTYFMRNHFLEYF